jgi:hypothetical protein
MNTETTKLTPQENTELANLVQKRQELVKAHNAAIEAPKRELEQLESDRRVYLQMIQANLESEIAKLRSKAYDAAALDLDKPRREELRRAVQALEERFQMDSAPLSNAAQFLLEKSSQKDALSLLPDGIRPTVIEIVGHRKPMYIVQHKLAPQCAFLVYLTSEGTRWGLVANTGLFKRRYSLVCFCESGCMTADEYSALIAELNTVCREHGITHLFARKVEERKGVNILDGSHYERTWKSLCQTEIPRHLQGKLYLDE